MVLPKLKGEDLLGELDGLDLGDTRLNERARMVLRSLAESPSSSLAKACDSESEREGMYRFFRNVRVDWEDLVAPHMKATASRASSCSSVLAIHDTTTIKVPDDADIESYINTGKKGFFAHTTLVTDASRDRFPLGVAGLEIIERAEKRRTKTKSGRAKSGSETNKMKDKEYDRWERQVGSVNELLQHADVTHVMDREADCFALLSYLIKEEMQFVIRLAKNRKARTAAPGSEWALVSDVLKDAKTFKRSREVFVSKRAKKTAPKYNKTHPARSHRLAQLNIAYAPMVLRAPAYAHDKTEEIQVNVVRIYETDVPEGETPIEWMLLTNRKVSSKKHAQDIVDIYRQRWLIEEFFKALKTGCSYSKRHLTNVQSIYNTLASFLPIAWRALLLRQLATNPKASITDGLSPDEIKFLRRYAKHLKVQLPKALKAQNVLEFIASLGGHRKHRGDPGWLTLMKGLERFQSVAEGWMLARAEM